MKVITEIDLRDLYKKEPFDTFTLEYPERLTPAASQFLTERRIRIIEVKNKADTVKKENNKSEVQSAPVALKEPEKGYLLVDSGEVVENKPEAYTHLKGRMLVLKNNKRIVFRGKLDSLEALFINTIIEVKTTGFKEMSNDLKEIFEYLKRIMRAEVLGEELQFIDFKGWSEGDIREYSHYPDKYFGVKHFVPDPNQGKLMSLLNILRSQLRELEVAAVDAFYNKSDKNIDRLDIILALNRMSSLIYIIQCQFLGGYYKI